MQTTGIEDRIVLVTGGGGGIGAAVVEALAAGGARVVVADVDAVRAADVARAAGSTACAMRLDVRDEREVADVFARVEREVGPLDVLVHAAGVFATSPLAELDTAGFDALWAVNARGTFFCLREVARHMGPRGRGAVVTIGSQSAKLVRHGQGAYGASKAASSYLTKCLGLELAALGIRCNVVHPGVTETPLARAVWDASGGPEKHVRAHVEGNPGRYRAPIPLGKIATAADVAAAVVFLASDAAGHVTMTELVVDGGAAMLA